MRSREATRSDEPGIVREQRAGRSPATVGVYLHIPFCERVCPYCDFAVVGGGVSLDLEERYVAALLAELEQRADVFRAVAPGGSPWLASLYFGGGTPSLLRPQSIERLVGAVHRTFRPSADGVEVTLEINPSTTERARLPDFRAAGVDRLSIGAQSFDDGVLRRLGRAHRASEIHRGLEAARAAGFDNLSLDLIFGAPGQSIRTLEADLAEIVRAAPEHVSTYELVVEPGTPFELAAQRGQLLRTSEDDAASMIDRIDERLGAAGYRRYELTNHALEGFASRHNQRYWDREPVLGLGVGAWSCDPPAADAPHGGRRANARELGRYLREIESGRPAAVEVERLEPLVARGEALFLGLRSRGVDAARFAAEFGQGPRHWFGRQIDELRAAGLIAETTSGDLRLTQRGQLLADVVCEAFV